MATRSSILGWRIIWAEEPGVLQSTGWQSLRHNWGTNTNMVYFQCSFSLWTFLEMAICMSTDRHTTTWARSRFNLQTKSDQIRSVAQSCLTLCDPMNCSTPGLPVHHQLPEFTQTHVHWVSDAIQPSHPLSSPSPPAPNPSQHQSLFQWVNSSHEVAKVLEFQL